MLRYSLFFFFFISNYLIAEEVVIDIKKQKKFADELYYTKEFYRAITEYQRLLHFFPKEKKLEIHLQIIRSYLAGKNYTEVIEYIEELKISSINIFQETNIKFLYSIALLNIDNHRIFQYRLKNIEKALRYLNDISTDSNKIKLFLQTWEENSSKLPYKNPWLAGSLSAILPGSGSFYNQRYKESFYSFFITSLFIAANIEAKNNEENTKEAIFSFFALAFYGGNIYTAINGAYKYNEYTKSNYLEKIRTRYNILFHY